MSRPHTITVAFSDNELARQLFGEHNSHLQRLAEILDVRINTRGTAVFVEGERVLAELAENLLNQLYGLLKEGYPLHPNDIEYAARMLGGNDRLNLKDIFLDTVYVTSKKSVITPKSPAQKAYIDAIRNHDIVFGIRAGRHRQEMVRRELEALANGQEGDPNFHKNMIDLLRYYYYEIVRPMMIAGETDCDFAKRVSVSKSMGWARQAELLRSGDELEQEVTEVKESYKKALSNCWKVSTEPCLNRNDVSRMQEALWVAREGQLMGLDFNINDVPECTCRSFWSYSAWELSFSMTYSRQAQAALEKNLGWANVSIDRWQTE